MTSNCETRSPDWDDNILNLGCGVFCAEQDLDPNDVYLVLNDLEASLSHPGRRKLRSSILTSLFSETGFHYTYIKQITFNI